MQINTKTTYYLTPVRMADIKKQETTSVGENMEKLELLYIIGGNGERGIAIMENRMESPKKIKNKTTTLIQESHF